MPWLYLLAMLIVVYLLVLVVVVNHVVQVRQRNVKNLFAVTVNRNDLDRFPVLFPETPVFIEQVLCVTSLRHPLNHKVNDACDRRKKREYVIFVDVHVITSFP